MSWLVKRRLSQNAARLRSLRLELERADEQLQYFRADADDTELRALVSETPGASHDAHDARKHADAMDRHRARLVETIAELERRQDDLLDRLGT